MGKNVVSDEEGKPSIFILILDKTTLKKLSEFLTLVAVGFEKTDEFEVEGEYEYEREHVNGHRGGRDIDDDEEDEEDGTVFRVLLFFSKKGFEVLELWFCLFACLESKKSFSPSVGFVWLMGNFEVQVLRFGFLV